jgi:hypothetical protein
MEICATALKREETKMNKFLLPLNLQFFAADDGGAGGGEPNPTPTEPTQPNEPVKTFTQDELNDIIEKRLARERKNYADYDELKSKLTDYEKQQEEKRLADLSEKERLEELLKHAEEAKSTKEKEYDNLLAQIKQERLHNAFITKANEKNVAYIDAALKLADLSNVQLTDEGITGLDEVINQLVEANPFLVKAAKEPQTIGGPNNPTPSKSDKPKEQLLKEAAEKARLSGKVEDKIAYVQLKRELGL